jgi:hypothetical protein
MTAPVQAPTKLEINVGDELQDHQGSWSCFAGEVACPRRRGDRIATLSLRCVRTRLAQSGHPKTSAHLSAFEGEADMGRRIVPIISAAFDPKRP